MIKFVILLGTLLGIDYVNAAAATVNKIFDKSQRVYQDPPKSLRASDNKRFLASGRPIRYANAAEKEKNVPQQTMEVEPVEPLKNYTVPPAEPKSATNDSYINQLRSEKRQAKLASLAYNGQRVFGIGFVGAGQYGVFGGELDFKLSNDWSGGFGVGTGMAYSTWAIHGRYYLHREQFSTFLKFGYANWLLGQMPRDPNDVNPNFLAKRFFSDDNGSLVLNKTAHLVYPSIGVDYQHDSGLAFHALLQYLINISDFNGALYASFGFFYYF